MKFMVILFTIFTIGVFGAQILNSSIQEAGRERERQVTEQSQAFAQRRQALAARMMIPAVHSLKEAMRTHVYRYIRERGCNPRQDYLLEERVNTLTCEAASHCSDLSLADRQVCLIRARLLIGRSVLERNARLCSTFSSLPPFLPRQPEDRTVRRNLEQSAGGLEADEMCVNYCEQDGAETDEDMADCMVDCYCQMCEDNCEEGEECDCSTECPDRRRRLAEVNSPRLVAYMSATRARTLPQRETDGSGLEHVPVSPRPFWTSVTSLDYVPAPTNILLPRVPRVVYPERRESAITRCVTEARGCFVDLPETKVQTELRPLVREMTAYCFGQRFRQWCLDDGILECAKMIKEPTTNYRPFFRPQN